MQLFWHEKMPKFINETDPLKSWRKEEKREKVKTMKVGWEENAKTR